MKDPIASYYALKKPCSNCPFLKHGAIQLRPGRLAGFVDQLLQNDHSSFVCHKTIHSSRGGVWDDDGEYEPSGNESMCAGAAAVLMAANKPSAGMRLALAIGTVEPDHWDEAAKVVRPLEELRKL